MIPVLFRRWCLPLLAAAMPLLAQEPERPPYAKFPAAGTDLLFSLFQTTYSYATDPEDLYPVVLQITRQGVPVWSQIATVDHDWPFLNMECKVAWSPDFKRCACSYRTGRATVVVLALDLSAEKVRTQAFPIDDLQDSVFETGHDTKAQVLSKAWTESVEIGNDGIVKLNLTVARSQTHRITALLDGKSGELKSWQPAPPAAK